MIDLYDALKNFPALSRQLNCKGMLFTQYDCPQTTHKEGFFVERSFIIYVIRGRRIFHKDMKTWDIKEGVCAFVKSGTHTAERLGNDEWCVMAFFVPVDFLKSLMAENRGRFPAINSTSVVSDHVILLDVDEFSKSFFFSMLPYFSQSPPPPENLVELKFKELILSLLSNENNRHFLSYLNTLSDDNRQSIEEIMNNNYRFNLTLDQYARLASKSVPTFKREFKRLFNDTPAKWVTKRRLALATELLERSSLRVGEIAQECGFENQTHFSRLFKEKVGESPLQFRMQRYSVNKDT
ncbi:MAG TPA: AraC family transcriptional regulator [Cyclobacteriaceae bacterium]|nr:AraC family transcriptional regulator [Cyclobacteriaceae bacterium]